MELAKAIEILNDRYNQGIVAESDDFIDAIKLGIEALKRLIDARTPQSVNPHLILPGETKD